MDTLFLATVIGWYFVITSLFLLFRYEHAKSIASDIMDQPGLLLVLAIFTLIIGLLMVASHNIWVMAWPVVVTVISWIVLVSGLIRLFFTDAVVKIGRSFLDHPMRMRITAVVTLLIGLFLLYQVYASHFGLTPLA